MDPAKLMEQIGGMYDDIGYDPASEAGFDPSSEVGDDVEELSGDEIGAIVTRGKEKGWGMAGITRAISAAQRAKSKRRLQHARNTALTGRVPAGNITQSLVLAAGATGNLILVSFIPMRVFRVDATAAVTATGADASGSVVINTFLFANRGIFDGSGTGTLAGFRPDANGRPPVRNIMVYPNTPITANLTNNNAGAVTASITLYGSTP